MKHLSYRSLALGLIAGLLALLAPYSATAQSVFSYQLLNNASSSGPNTYPVGGDYLLSLKGTFGGATVTITTTQTLGGAVQTLGAYTAAPSSPPCITVPAGTLVQATVAGGSPSGLYALLGGVGAGGCSSIANATTQGILNSAIPVPPFPVFQVMPNSTHITTATTTAAIVSGPGVIGTVLVNTLVASGTITLYDSLTASGTVIGIIATPSTITGVTPFQMPYNRVLANGLTAVTTGAQDVTITSKGTP